VLPLKTAVEAVIEVLRPLLKCWGRREMSRQPSKCLMLNIIVVRHDIPISEGGSLASYIDTQNAFPSVHSAAPQLPLT
jgi:hypothetical protein